MLKRLILEPQGPTTYVLALMLIVLLAVGVGLWVGWMSVPQGGVPQDGQPVVKNSSRPGKVEEVLINKDAPPLVLLAAPGSDAEWSDYLGEIQLAASQGIHRYSVPLRLSWREPWDSLPMQRRLEAIVAVDPEAMFIIELDLNPPAEWLSSHPESAVQCAGQKERFASPFAPAWKNYVIQEAGYQIDALKESPYGRRISGYILSAMFEGSWRFEASGYDDSLATKAAFENWLVTRHGSLEAAAQRWGMQEPPRPITPAFLDPAAAEKVFIELPAELQYADFHRFLSEGTADSLARIAAEVRQHAGDDAELLARYGYSLEIDDNTSGHFSLHQLQNSELDGFICPVSYASRGSGGTGGPMAPIHSAKAHGKRWYLLDDTRTGVARDPLTGAISRLEGLRPEDVYTVQERNFSLALTQGMGLIWADPHAQGWLHEAGQWEKFRQLADIYCETYPEYSMTRKEETKETEAPKEGEVEDSGYAAQAPVALQVVVDEESRFLQKMAGPLNNALLLQGRDAAIMSGVPAEFVLLDDVVEERTPAASVYLFLNAFQMTTEERERLQARLANEAAAAIWLYAPGYFRDEPRTDHIISTARITVEPFSKPERAGSKMAINGRWIRQNESFGYRGVLNPLFYINDNEADVIALFEGSNKPSVAMKTLESGWTSVLISDASISPQLLRELLRILEQQVYFRPTSGRYLDTTYFGDGYMAIHARQVGERAVDLGDYFDVTDALDASVGWPERDSFLLQMDQGETRLLRLAPTQ